jgi:hypothetical protein|tara:strand:- start:932 stop:1390 length:459 start_codon:yes stop_codon:yes gene_type:complete
MLPRDTIKGFRMIVENMDEHGFVKSLHLKLPKTVYKWKIHDVYAGGVPDAYYEGEEGCCWIEYKYVKSFPLRPTSIIKHSLSNLQKQWLRRANSNGQNAYVVIGSYDKVVILSNKEWEIPLTNEYFDNNALPRQAVVNWITSICTTGHPSTL